MKKLILIGYWHNWKETHWPDPARFVDPSWDLETRETVINYLDSGKRLFVSMGTSWCRFRCHQHGHAFGLGSATLTDGVYLWPDGLSHYLDAHDVRLPDEFVEHALRHSKQPDLLEASLQSLAEESDLDEEHDWWRAQTGFTEGKSFLSPRLYIGLTITATVPPSEPNDAILNFLHRNGFVRYWRISTPELFDEIRNGAEFSVGLTENQIKTSIQECRKQFTSQANEAGILLKFVEHGQEELG